MAGGRGHRDEDPAGAGPRGEVPERIGQYEVIATLGEGGMGKVYRARDPRLDRQVALKVLSDAFVSDAERLARFGREAKILASLNHPNIGHIYGLEEADGIQALVLELVEGPTLADRIAQGPIPIDEALPIARQIADALEAAHQRGIIHRDLKPANVKVTSDGTVKVLDFGLAKAFLPDTADRDPDVSPTLTAATGMGVVLGTAAYMAPEQARGRPVDKRADVWAFGAVLFEMLTGKRPFAAADVSGTLARVIEREPDWDALPRDLPPMMRTFLRRCLAKEPGQRIHDIADMRLAIDGAFEPATSSTGTLVPQPRTWQRPVVISAMVAAAAIVAALAGWYARPVHRGEGVLRFTLPLPTETYMFWDVESHNLALAPDGRRLAFAAAQPDIGRQLWLHSLDRDEAEPLAGTEDAYSPFWSPDGRWLAYFTSTSLRKLRPGMGPPEVVCTIEGEKSGAWSTSGSIVFAVAYGESRGLYRVDASGGEPQPIAIKESDDRIYPYWPVLLPRGTQILYTAFKRTGTEEGAVPHLHVADLVSGDTRSLFRVESRVGIAPGHLVYVEQGNLLARPFDLETLAFVGDAIPLGSDVPQFPTAWAPFAVSSSGAVAYQTETEREIRLSWRDRVGRELGTVSGTERFDDFSLSPDGTQLAARIREGGDDNLWIFDLQRNVPTRLTSSPGMKGTPIWSPDGSRIVYPRHGPKIKDNDLYMQELTGGEATPLKLPAGLPWALAWSPDGNWLAYRAQADIWLFPIHGGEPVRRTGTHSDEWAASFSPDGRWLAYASDESGDGEIYVAPVEGTDRGVRVSTDGGDFPFWRGDGKEVFYSSYNGIMTAPIGYREGRAVPGSPERLFSGKFELVGVTADGERLLVAEKIGQRAQTLRMITNWVNASASPN